jgi:transcriptional regulator with XRE-family HTH domain
MNERFRLNSKAVREFLAKGDLKQSFLVKRLNCSQSLVAQMLREGHVPGDEKLKALAAEMGVQVDDLLIPRSRRTA